MTTSSPASAVQPQTAPPLGARLPAWLREPLLHFLVLGALLFALDHWRSTRADDPRTIVVGDEVNKEVRQLFVTARGREPNDQELRAMRERWLDNEVLYREGLALQLDRGDATIRERVIFKALNVVDANVKRPPVDEQVLRAWFERNRSKYDEPPRYDFEEAVLDGDNSEAAVRSFVVALNAGTPGDAKAGLRVFKGRPEANLLQSYGAEFAKALAASPPGEWRALPTRDGLRAMRLTSMAPGRPADYDALRNAVFQDWTDAVMAEQRTSAVRALAQKYKVVLESGPR